MRGVIIQEAVARYHWLFASRHDSRSRAEISRRHSNESAHANFSRDTLSDKTKFSGFMIPSELWM